ncbi:PE-PPE domain-containing protein [Mycolicibacterium sp.]|uniref:PE-PPE domain-containing protein n=1 Tax=Mycolicibacterium sp. TaxID=2320850 RepID=UPI001A23C44E|nr:PE-PPE domain-containing protein [Mycolicibacterium sp.]MBJ7340337.1 PE-PPE domain-containing protein [Mycolicibacterium sp.]
MPKKRRARRTVIAGAAAAGLSGALVAGHATGWTPMVQLAASTTNTVIAAGGLYDITGSNVRNKLSHTVVPPGYDYAGVAYPATANLSGSRDAGVPVLHALITSNSTDQFIVVAGYSEGTLLAEQERRNLQLLPLVATNAGDPVAPPTSQLSFVMIGSPFAGNGGIYARFPTIGIPGITDPMGATQPSRYDTTYHTNEYDTYGDFPAYFNPLALLNTALGIRYSHPDPAYDPLDPNGPRYVTGGTNSAGGHDTYILYYNPQLPLLGPLRDISSLFGATALTEPFISAVEPLLRVLVDMSYTDRVNANPTAAVPFSLITPPQTFIEALNAIPGALAQGLANLVSGGHAAVTLPDPIGNLQQGPTSQAAPPSTQTSEARVSRALTSQRAVPEQTPQEEPPASAAPLKKPEETTSSPEPATSSATPAPSSNAPEAGLHPTVTSDGNKFTPGTDGAAAQGPSAGGDTTPTTTTTATTATTTTTTATTSTISTKTDPTPEPATNDTQTGKASAAAAA